MERIWGAVCMRSTLPFHRSWSAEVTILLYFCIISIFFRFLNKRISCLIQTWIYDKQKLYLSFFDFLHTLTKAIILPDKLSINTYFQNNVCFNNNCFWNIFLNIFFHIFFSLAKYFPEHRSIFNHCILWWDPLHFVHIQKFQLSQFAPMRKWHWIIAIRWYKYFSAKQLAIHWGAMDV